MLTVPEYNINAKQREFAGHPGRVFDVDLSQDGLCVSVDPETLALNVQTVPRESVQGSVDTFIVDFNALQRSVGVCYANAGKVLFSSSML